ncbi:conserved hypothetical protein [Ricinus communis]|uniref:Uncharacterized protein n=1 Tax=Ricinus communis TaxID=3988 RepID=B9S6L5_RICCO|nr:conserved hypothetical protein [Ricinus communis]
MWDPSAKLFEAAPATLAIRRTATSLVQEERPEVITEETHLRTAGMMKEARAMPDNNKLYDARGKLIEAQHLLEDVVDDRHNPVIRMSGLELQQFLKLMKSQEMYQKRGRSFAPFSEISYDRQRFASRGETETLRLFPHRVWTNTLSKPRHLTRIPASRSPRS